MQYSNFDLRMLIQEKGITFRSLANFFGVTPCTFTRWMNKDLTREKRMKILSAIHELEKRGVENG